MSSFKDKISAFKESHLSHKSDTPNTTSTAIAPENSSEPQRSAADTQRGQEILSVFHNAFGDLLAGDPDAFQTKFRKMAASPFAFYRGSACLFYRDLHSEANNGPYLDARTKQVWIHGDLHAENFGTYMDSQGELVFNVNDFDEAYIGPFTWDLYRLVASLALLGYAKALSDKQISRLITAYTKAYHERIHEVAVRGREVNRFTLRTAEGPLLKALQTARVQSRIEMLDSSTEIRDADRRFSKSKGVIELDDDTKQKLQVAFDKYLETLPDTKIRETCRIKDCIGKRGVGIGSAGLPTYNILIEGASEALENDRIVYLKQSQPSAVSRHVDIPAARTYFKHEGHRTVISQRARKYPAKTFQGIHVTNANATVQDHADPWAGWTEIDGAGYMVSEVSPYAVDFEWSDVNAIDKMTAVVADFGRATAMMHGAADKDSEHAGLVDFSTEEVIDAAIAKDEAGFEKLMLDFGHSYSAKVRKDHELFVDMFRNGQIPGLEEKE